MDMNHLQAVNAYQNSSRTSPMDKSKEQNTPHKVLLTNEAGNLVQGSPSAVYEKSDIITALQNDAEARAKQLHDMVADAIHKQAGLSLGGDDVWKFLAKGDFSVTEEAKKQAQELISEDGYYGVKQTSDRILQFAQALSGGDVSKGKALLDAFKKGFKEATKSWGKDLPEICQKTYDEVERKFNDWMNGEETK